MRKTWDFDDGRSGFRYEDDIFRLGGEADEAEGSYARKALVVKLDGENEASGGWTRSFRLEKDQDVTLTFRYKINHDAEDEGFTDVRAALDGAMIGAGGEPYVTRLLGTERKTGWTTVEIDLGRLQEGEHELALGGFSDGASSAKLRFKNVKIESDEFKLGKFEAKVLKHTNAFRKENALDPLRADPNLTEAAEDWSREMAKGDFVRHSDVLEQATEHGYDPILLGENIAWGQRTPKEVVEGWIGSPGHRANLLREDFTQIGIGYYRLKDDEGDLNAERYWTQIFGTPSDDYML